MTLPQSLGISSEREQWLTDKLMELVNAPNSTPFNSLQAVIDLSLPVNEKCFISYIMGCFLAAMNESGLKMLVAEASKEKPN